MFVNEYGAVCGGYYIISVFIECLVSLRKKVFRWEYF